MTLVAVLARNWRRLASNVSKQSFDVAASLQVQLLLWSPLLCQAHARFPCQPLGQCTLDNDILVARLESQALGGVG